MKPTKSKKKEVPAKGSNASIPDYFKATEKEPSKSVAPFARDVKSVYVSALLNKVKSKLLFNLLKAESSLIFCDSLGF